MALARRSGAWTVAAIAGDIEIVAGGAYCYWRIGITDDPIACRDELGVGDALTCWREWQAQSLADAVAIESYFVRKGMRAVASGELSPSRPIWIFVF